MIEKCKAIVILFSMIFSTLMPWVLVFSLLKHQCTPAPVKSIWREPVEPPYANAVTPTPDMPERISVPMLPGERSLVVPNRPDVPPPNFLPHNGVNDPNPPPPFQPQYEIQKNQMDPAPGA